ncbi:hypothetical protein C7N43_36350 [Sphingobacteriales bacterium UPWRP_1]|nr:hypothetical protein C7N43_36350 [Sphingobacteriales bacterium UPWRP_1]
MFLPAKPDLPLRKSGFCFMYAAKGVPLCRQNALTKLTGGLLVDFHLLKQVVLQMIGSLLNGSRL